MPTDFFNLPIGSPVLYATTAEKHVISSMMSPDAEVTDAIRHLLSEADFTQYFAIMIFRSIVELRQDNVVADLVTVHHRLASTDRLKELGEQPAIFLAEIFELERYSANWEHYVRIVREASQRREIVRIGMELAGKAESPEGSVEELLDSAYSRLFALQESRNGSDPVPVAQIMDEAIDRYTEAQRPDYVKPILPTGWQILDQAIGGFRPGQLVIVGARPGSGKSAFLLQWLRQLEELGHKTLMFSLEMLNDESADRMIASVSRVRNGALRSGAKLSLEECDRVLDASRSIKQSHRGFILDRPNLTSTGLLATARRYIRRHGIRVIALDYLQLLRPTNPKEHRNAQIGEQARDLKLLAMDERVLLIVASQLNRNVDSRSNSKPMLSDLRDSGEIEQHADVVTFLSPRSEDKSLDNMPMLFDIAKFRGGPIGEHDMIFSKKFLTFEEEIPL